MKIHRFILIAIRVIAVAYLLWRVYTFIADTILLRNAKSDDGEVHEEGSVLRNLVSASKGGKP